MIDMQTALLDEVIQKLAAVPEFGGLVFEDSVMRVIDSEDPDLPDNFIIIQPGQTEEVERIGSESLRERYTLNITLVTQQRNFAAPLRAGRLAVKSLFAGRHVSLVSAKGQPASFLTETPMPPQEGRRFAVHVMPLQVGYIQNY
jgi:hypothetical protein